MATDPKAELLSQVKMFSSLNKKELARVSKASDVVKVAGGTEIVHEGEIGHEFYLILSGSATVAHGGEDVAELRPGNYFGELALLDQGPRSATVTADTDTELVIIGQREFAAVIEDIPAVAHKLLISMAARLREADNRALSH